MSAQRLAARSAVGAAVLVLVLGVVPRAEIRDQVFSFEEDAIGAVPAGFFFAGARQNSAGIWAIKGIGPKHHLSHTGDPTIRMRGMSLASVVEEAPVNLTLSVKVRFVDGDRAAGLIWRYRDSSNFYALGVNLSDRTASIFRVTDGNRVRLAFAADLDLDPDAWHSIGIAQVADQMRAQVDGISLMRARDRTLRSGRAGIWSAGNSSNWFDDVRITSAGGQ